MINEKTIKCRFEIFIKQNTIFYTISKLFSYWVCSFVFQNFIIFCLRIFAEKLSLSCELLLLHSPSLWLSFEFFPAKKTFFLKYPCYFIPQWFNKTFQGLRHTWIRFRFFLSKTKLFSFLFSIPATSSAGYLTRFFEVSTTWASSSRSSTFGLQTATSPLRKFGGKSGFHFWFFQKSWRISISGLM